jgi:hypothetical protein
MANGKWQMANGKSVVEKVRGGWMCCKGRHLWWDKENAEKCCSGKWKRVLVIGGGTHQQICAGVSIGRAWEPC